MCLRTSFLRRIVSPSSFAKLSGTDAPSHPAMPVSALRNDLKSIETQIGRLLTAVAEGSVPDVFSLRKKMDDLNGRRDESLNLLRALDNELPEFRRSLSKQQAANIAKNLKQRLLEAPRALQKRYVHGLVSENHCGSEKGCDFRSRGYLSRCCVRPGQARGKFSVLDVNGAPGRTRTQGRVE